MIDTWKSFLGNQGAHLDGASIAHFGDPAREREAAAHGSIVTDLSQLGVLAFSGEDTVGFLQGQLTNDVHALAAGGAQWSGYCSPKGRLLGNFLVWRQGDDMCLQMAGDIAADILKRLSMFILRAKVKVRDASNERVRLAVAGPAAAAAVETAMGVLPPAAMLSAVCPSGLVVGVGDNMFILSVVPGAAADVWQTLTRHAIPVGAPVWDWLRLNAGIPMIDAATQDKFVPQMVNLEAIGGVSFRKGCYPGQEIVARSQYLGKVKRRMFLAHVDTAAAPGDSLYSADLPGQTTGTIVNIAPALGGGYDLLAVAQVESAAKESLRLRAGDGAPLVLKPLPYAVPE